MNRTDLAGIEQALWLIKDALLDIKETLKLERGAPSKKEESIKNPENSNSLSRFESVEIDFTCLSVWAANCLRSAGIKTVGDLIKMTPNQFLELKMVGLKSRDEFLTYLKRRHGLVYGWDNGIYGWRRVKTGETNDD